MNISKQNIKIDWIKIVEDGNKFVIKYKSSWRWKVYCSNFESINLAIDFISKWV